MVKNEKQHIEKTRAKQGFPADSPEPYNIKLRLLRLLTSVPRTLRPMVDMPTPRLCRLRMCDGRWEALGWCPESA